MSTGIVILAAGESARMGEPKQLLEYRETTLLHHAIDTALELEVPVVVVLGAHAAEIRGHFDDTRALVVENPAWHFGMGGSLRAGLRALLSVHPDTGGAIFMLCDQPLVSAAVLRELIATHARSGLPIVASEYGGTLGVPALFACGLFPELLALDGTSGAREIIQNHRAQATAIIFPEGRVDIDTPTDYAGLRSASSEPSRPTSIL